MVSEAWADWLSYRPSDFLMFSPRTYWRLFELHNLAWWPLQVLALAAGAAGAVAVARAGAVAQRAVPWMLAAAWGFVAWYFHAERYAPINWAAVGLAWLFAAQALVLVGLASLPAVPVLAGTSGAHLQRGHWRNAGAAPQRRWAAVALWLFALVLYPCLAPLQGRPFAQSEVLGLAPDPTVVATLAWLLATSGRAPTEVWRRLFRIAAWALALAAAAASAATLATMGEPQALGLVVAIVLAIVPAIAFGCRRRSSTSRVPSRQ